MGVGRSQTEEGGGGRMVGTRGHGHKFGGCACRAMLFRAMQGATPSVAECLLHLPVLQMQTKKRQKLSPFRYPQNQIQEVTS